MAPRDPEGSKVKGRTLIEGALGRLTALEGGLLFWEFKFTANSLMLWARAANSEEVEEGGCGVGGCDGGQDRAWDCAHARACA